MNTKKSSTYSMFIIGALFFVFGFVTWLNNILIPYMKTSCELTSQVQAYLVPFAFYIAYFVMSIPSALPQAVFWRPILIPQKESV